MDEQWIIDKIKAAGLKLTRPRMLVIEVLRQNKNGFISADEIFNLINHKEKVCDLTSIYRTLTSLEEIQLVEKSDFFGEASQYRLLSHQDHYHHHHHYFKCNECGKIEVLCGDCNVVQYENDLKKRGFSNLSHRLELSGLCPSCNK
jgi:Fe2+ or Zn2+ uptake regulation protein